MSLDYAHEKLMTAVGGLATGTARLQQRLADAAMCFVAIKPEDDFPDEELRRAFLGIMDDLTFEDGADGRIAATMRVTSDEDARDLAKRIVSLYHAVDRRLRP
jgi:hypothetical protein